MKRKIAVVGGGIAGLTAAYLLSKKYDVTLFEKDNRLGGCAYTHRTKTGEMIDLGVTNAVNPPARDFLKLCDQLNIKMIRHPASAGISIHNLETNNGLYLTPLSLKGLLSQKFALFSSVASLAKPMMDIRNAIKMMDEGKLNDLTYEELFKRMQPMTEMSQSAIMSLYYFLTIMDPEDMLKIPAEHFFNIIKAYKWFNPFRAYFPKNLTQSYVEALASPYKDKVVLNSKIKSIARNDKTVTLKMEDGKETVFDKIVFACYADQALTLLEKPTDDEKRLLGAWKYFDVPAVVHRDNSSLPKRELCQLWTVTQTTRNGKSCYSASNSSWMAPAVSKKSEYITTLNPNFEIKESLIDLQTSFRMPFYDSNSFSTVKKLPSLNGRMNSYYCGGYMAYNLHGDTANTAFKVAGQLGIE